MAELFTNLGQFIDENQVMVLLFVLILFFTIVMRKLKKQNFEVKLLFTLAFSGLFALVLTLYGPEGIDLFSRTEGDPNNIFYWMLWCLPLVAVFILLRARKKVMKVLN